VPIVIAQHTIPGFEDALAQWLGETGHKTRVIMKAGPIAAGEVALARADCHLAVRAGRFELVPPAGLGPVPSVDVLFQSAAEVYGASAAALLLTGMGEDGKVGLSAMRKRGAVTITQRADTCVIDGMPGAARRAGASEWDFTPAEMAAALRFIAGAGPAG
jgi:two-component system chemotaxis response regulator CheB